MRRKGHYVYEKYDKGKYLLDSRDVKRYGLYSSKVRHYHSADLVNNSDASTNAKIYVRDRSFTESRYVSDGLDFTPSIWGLVLAIVFFLALTFLFKGLADNSSIFDTGLSLADVISDYGSSFRDNVLDVSKAFSDSGHPDWSEFDTWWNLPGTLQDLLHNAIGLNFTVKLNAVVEFFVSFIYNFVLFIVRILVLIFA